MGSWHSQYKVPNPAKYYFSAGPCPPHTNCGGGPSTNKSGHYISVLGYNSGLEFPSGHLERGAAAGKLLDGASGLLRREADTRLIRTGEASSLGARHLFQLPALALGLCGLILSGKILV